MKNRFLESVFALGLLGAAVIFPQPSLACCPTAAEVSPSIPVAAAGIKTAMLSVEGMTCASCSMTIRLTLKKLDGVKEAIVKVDTKRAVVQYDPAKVTPQQLAEAVSKAGYKATVLPEP